VAQPALSHHLAELEAYLGTKLLTRLARGVELTEPGEMLLGYAQNVLKTIAQAEQAVRHRAAQPSGPVSVGMLHSIAPALTPPLLHAARQRFPHVQLLVVEGDSRVLRDGMQSGKLDMAVNLSTVGNRAALPLAREDLFLVGPPGAFPAKRRAMPLAEALRHPLILPNFRHGIRRTVEDAASARKLTLDIVWEMEGLATTKSAVAAGLGFTIAGWASIQPDCLGGRLSALRIARPGLQRMLVLDMPGNGLSTLAVLEIRVLLVRIVADLVTKDVLRGRLP
jgi:LysR family nitrogen assimilation transcriptional regulator